MPKTIRLSVKAPQLRANHRLVITGADDVLGAWHVDKGMRMTEHVNNEWTVDINADSLSSNEMEFKFAAIDINNGNAATWETGDNRTIDLVHLADGDISVYSLDQAFFPFHNIKIAGTLVPVFSLRSKTSFGVGDFGDLKKMIDLVAQTGQRLLQVLPINDTTITHGRTATHTAVSPSSPSIPNMPTSTSCRPWQTRHCKRNSTSLGKSSTHCRRLTTRG